MKCFTFTFLVSALCLSANAAQYLSQEPVSKAFVKISSSSCPSDRKILGEIDSGQVICDGGSRVQLGAFKDLSNAVNFVTKMRSQGIDTLISPGIDGQVNRVFFSIGGGVSFSEDSLRLIEDKLARDGVKYSLLSNQQASAGQSVPQPQSNTTDRVASANSNGLVTGQLNSLTSSAKKDNWTLVAQREGNGTRWYIDFDSMNIKSPGVYAYRELYDSDESFDVVNDDRRQAKSVVEEKLINCIDGTTKGGVFTAYSENMGNGPSFTGESKLTMWLGSEPDTPRREMVVALCQPERQASANNKSSEPESKRSKPDNTKSESLDGEELRTIILIVAVMLGIPLVIYLYAVSGKECPSCKMTERGSVEEVNSVVLNEFSQMEYRTEVDTHRNKNGEKIGTTERRVQELVTHGTRRIIYSCNKCGHLWDEDIKF
jgi:hypothetical protein